MPLTPQEKADGIARRAANATAKEDAQAVRDAALATRKAKAHAAAFVPTDPQTDTERKAQQDTSRADFEASRVDATAAGITMRQERMDADTDRRANPSRDRRVAKAKARTDRNAAREARLAANRLNNIFNPLKLTKPD